MCHEPKRLALGLCAALWACEPGGVGDPCIPEDEYQPTFAGFDEAEVNIESRSVQCETRLCLVDHFQGRVSCPYGQTEADLTLDPADPRRCRIPGTNGKKPGDAVTVPVKPQIVRLTAAASPKRSGNEVQDHVYCSCRCANAQGSRDDGARYCDCPSGFSCTKLIDDLGLGSAELAGSYCVRDRSWDPYTTLYGLECSSITKNCGNDGKNP